MKFSVIKKLEANTSYRHGLIVKHNPATDDAINADISPLARILVIVKIIFVA